MSTRNLASIGFDIDRLFQEFENKTSDQPCYRALLEQQQRFELWATNIGLHQYGHASLDYRFRDAPDIYQYCHSLLEDLQRTLDIGLCHVPFPSQVADLKGSDYSITALRDRRSSL